MIQILICDDDPQFVLDLHESLVRLYGARKPGIAITDICDPSKITKQDAQKADILFLDVDMGKISGIDLAREIRKTRKNAVLIYVSNYLQYAPAGYEVNAFRYIEKNDLHHKLPLCFEQALAMHLKENACISITCEKEQVEIPVSSFVYAEVYQKTHSLLLHLTQFRQDTMITNMTIRSLEESLKEQGFLRIHKSYLVNMSFIKSISSTVTILKNGETLPTSARGYQNIKALWLEWKGDQ